MDSAARPAMWMRGAKAAAYTGYSEGWLRDLAAQGKVPAHRRPDSRTGPWRYRRDELDKWLGANSTSPGSV